MRVFIVGMPGEGNLGDDLISALLVGHVRERWPTAEVGILHGRHRHPFDYLNPASLTVLGKPIRSDWRSYRSRWRRISHFLNDTDLILIGGGGLFQDTWSPFTAHWWMKYSFHRKALSIPAWAVGVGFELLRTRFSHWYLRNFVRRLSLIQVRDQGSRRMAEELFTSTSEPPPILDGTDVVLGSSLSSTPFGVSYEKDPSLLGCAIRPWEGMKFDQVVGLIASICRRHRMQAALFVFHYDGSESPEHKYAQRVEAELRGQQIECRVLTYLKDPMEAFAEAFCRAGSAIASPYHANILWQKLGTPVIPIDYYPKVGRLYRERGGSPLPLDDLLSVTFAEAFQTLQLGETYRLPAFPVDVHDNSHAVSRATRLVLRLVDLADGADALRRLAKGH